MIDGAGGTSMMDRPQPSARTHDGQPTAEIVTIGDELLLGEIVDTNAAHLGQVLREAGMDVRLSTTVGDHVEMIATVVRAAAERAAVVICTGGLGPTVDDPTREALAMAAGVPLRFEPELWKDIEAMFIGFGRTPTPNNRRQAHLPEGATAIANPVGTAPGIAMDIAGALVVALPGVPSEMTYLLEHAVLPLLSQRFGPGNAFVIRVLHTVGVGESQVDDALDELLSLHQPRIGLAAHKGTVDVRLTARAPTTEAAEAIIAPVEAEVRRRLGAWIRDADGDIRG